MSFRCVSVLPLRQCPPVVSVSSRCADVLPLCQCFPVVSMYFRCVTVMRCVCVLRLFQVTMADNHTVDRCRAWCQSTGVHYVRLSPLLSSDVQLDETGDEVLLQMLWEAVVYCKNKKNVIERLANALVLVS